jgi:hypothetical protein
MSGIKQLQQEVYLMSLHCKLYNFNWVLQKCSEKHTSLTSPYPTYHSDAGSKVLATQYKLYSVPQWKL